jgi:hypothetical protein
MINFRQSLYTEEHAFKPLQQGTAHTGNICGLEINVNNVLVKNNNTPAVFPFPGYAKVYFLNLVAANLRGAGLRLQLKAFEKVENDDALAMDKTLCTWQRERPEEAAPGELHIFSALIKSRQPLRDTASVLSEVQRDGSYKLLTAALDSLLKSNTPAEDISNLLFNIAGIVGKYLGKLDEKPLFCWLQSFTGITTAHEVLGKTEKAAANYYASMGLSITIKDEVRMEEEALLQRTDRRPATGVRTLF